MLRWLALYAAEQWATGAAPAGGRGPLSGGYACYSIYAIADARALTVADELLAALGHESAAIAALRAAGVI